MSSSHSTSVDTAPQRPNRAPVEVPHFFADVIGVGVEDVLSLVGVAGDVDLHDAIDRNRVDVHVGGRSRWLRDET